MNGTALAQRGRRLQEVRLASLDDRRRRRSPKKRESPRNSVPRWVQERASELRISEDLRRGRVRPPLVRSLPQSPKGIGTRGRWIRGLQYFSPESTDNSRNPFVAPAELLPSLLWSVSDPSGVSLDSRAISTLCG